MITIENLKELGCNTDEGLERCLNDEGFYLQLIPDAFNKKRYEDLESHIVNKDLDTAFDEAHALKGVLANLAITPLFDVVSEITEKLRAKEEAGYSELISKMWDVFSRFESLL